MNSLKKSGLALCFLVIATGGLALLIATDEQATETLPSNRADFSRVVDSASVVSTDDDVHPSVNVGAHQVVSPKITYDSYNSRFGPLPKSLHGTSLPINFALDANGSLIPDKNLRILFDYFFTTVGEESEERVVERIQELLAQTLPSLASGEALDILQRYLNLRNGVADLIADLGHGADPSASLANFETLYQMRRDLRLEHLSSDIYDAFYADEDKRAEYTLESIRIRQRTDITEAEKTQLLAELVDILPPQARQRRVREQARQDLSQRVEEAKLDGASASEIFQLRADVLGIEAAERYAKADEQAAQWDQRVEEYRAQRQQILDLHYLTPEHQQEQIAELQQSHFNEQERLRIPVIDRMRDQAAAKDER